MCFWCWWCEAYTALELKSVVSLMGGMSQVIRVCRENWFADVPATCDWVGDSSTHIAVVVSRGDVAASGERLEMSGRVIVRHDSRVVISCGGLILSITPEYVSPMVKHDVTVVFTRSQPERQPVCV